MKSTTITLSDTNAHNVLDVLTGKDVTGAATGTTFNAKNVPAQTPLFSLQADPGNGDYASYGDSGVTDTNRGGQLVASAYLPLFIAPPNGFALKDLYLKAHSGTLKFNIMFQEV